MNFLTGPFEQTPILFGSARVPFRVPFWLEKALPCADPLWVLGPEGSVHSGLRLFGSRFSLNVGFLENTEGSTDLVALQQDMQHGFATHPAWRLTSTNAWPDPIQHGIAVSHFLFKSYSAEGLCVALPETISKTYPLKINGWKMDFLLGRPIFMCYVSFREWTFSFFINAAILISEVYRPRVSGYPVWRLGGWHVEVNIAIWG